MATSSKCQNICVWRAAVCFLTILSQGYGNPTRGVKVTVLLVSQQQYLLRNVEQRVHCNTF